MNEPARTPARSEAEAYGREVNAGQQGLFGRFRTGLSSRGDNMTPAFLNYDRDEWEPLERDVPDELYGHDVPYCPDCSALMLGGVCPTCLLTDDEIAQRLTGAR